MSTPLPKPTVSEAVEAQADGATAPPLWSPTATAYALAEVVRTCARDFCCDLCAITLDDGGNAALAAYGRGVRRVPPTTLRDLETGTRLTFRSRLEVPLSADSIRVGTVILYARRRGAFAWVGEAQRRVVGELAGARLEEARRHDRTQRLAFVDGLTGFFTRAYYLERLDEAVAYAGRYGEPLAVVAFDFDNLKLTNEKHGYPAGSRLLADTVRDQRRHLRRSDVPCRVMGDEFAIIALRTDLNGGWVLARQIQEAAEALEIRVPADKTRTGLPSAFRSAISVGVAALLPDEDAEALTSRALLAVQEDKCLRRAQNRPTGEA